jgi:undecaprenyl-diphosphatase
MDIFQAIILGIVQGITEWLPISSSGHLVLFQQLFGITQPIVFDVMLHLGSLVVVLIFFWKQIRELIIGVFRLDKEKIKLLLFIVLATIPIAVVGLFFGNQIERAFDSLLVVGIGLLFTSLLLFLSKYPKVKSGKLTWDKTLLIGVSQAIAILPGVSRSGSTISTGMILGIKKEDVARFSFIIFIPAIIGAAIVELGNIGSVENIPAMIIGTLFSIAVGFFSLKLLMNIIQKDRFSWFGIYCLVLGLVVIGLAIIY